MRLHAAAISAVASMLIYIPPYAIVAGAGVFEAPPGAIALQALVQGLLTAVISYVIYGLAIGILGASSGAAFAASCPAMTALMGIPILGEWPSRSTGSRSPSSRWACTSSAAGHCRGAAIAWL